MRHELGRCVGYAAKRVDGMGWVCLGVTGSPLVVVCFGRAEVSDGADRVFPGVVRRPVPFLSSSPTIGECFFLPRDGRLHAACLVCISFLLSVGDLFYEACSQVEAAVELPE